MKRGLLALLSLGLFCACQQISDNGGETRAPLYVKADNLKFSELITADSLYSIFQTQEALNLYYKLASQPSNDSLSQLATRRLSEIKHQYIFLNNQVDIPVNSSTKELDQANKGQLFFTKLRHRQRIEISELKKQLTDCHLGADSVSTLLHISTCYLNQEENLDSSWHYGRQAYDVVVQYEGFTQLHYQVFDFVQRLAKYRRNSYLSVGLMSDAINALELMPKVNKVWLSNAYLQRSYAYLSFAEYDKAHVDGEKVKALEQDDSCSTLYQSALVGDLYRVGIKNAGKGHSIIERLKTTKESCPNLMLNLDRNIGQYFSANGRLAESIFYLEQADRFEKQSLFYNYEQYQSIIYMLSKLYQEVKEYEKALDVVGANMNMFLDSENGSANIEIILLERVASIYYSQYEFSNDGIALEKCLELLDKVESTTDALLENPDESKVRTFLYYQDLAYAKLSTIHFEQYEKTKLDQHKTLCYGSLSKKHGLIFVTEILTNQRDKRIDEVLQSEKKILQKKQATILSEGHNSGESLTEVQWALENLAAKLVAQPKVEDAFSLRDRRSIEDLQPSLANDHSLLNYYIVDDHLYINHLTRNEHTLVRKEWTEEHRALILNLISLQASKSVTIGEYQDMAFEAFRILIGEGLWSELKQEVIVVPNDILNFLSFEALVSSAGHPKNLLQAKELQYLIKDKAFLHLPSEQLLQLDQKDKESLQPTSKVAVFGYSDVQTMSKSYGDLPELPFGYLETQKLKKTFVSCDLFTGASNSKTQFLETLTGDYDLVHVATHGVGNAKDRYGIKLYFRDQALRIDSLYGYELFDVNINAKLIVLSACQSGLGYLDEILYSDGVYNLERYFLMQGAGQVVSALWDLDDQSTSSLMEHYYNSGTRSLRESKLKLIKENPQWGLPFYWAALN